MWKWSQVSYDFDFTISISINTSLDRWLLPRNERVLIPKNITCNTRSYIKKNKDVWHFLSVLSLIHCYCGLLYSITNVHALVKYSQWSVYFWNVCLWNQLSNLCLSLKMLWAVIFICIRLSMHFECYNVLIIFL